MACRTIPVPFVLDFDGMGQLIGIEILNLKDHAGSACLARLSEDIRIYPEPISFSYDDEADAFYLRIRDGRSIDQQPVMGRVELDSAGHIVGFEADSEQDKDGG
jgi:uncharacterized protein YuzE